MSQKGQKASCLRRKSFWISLILLGGIIAGGIWLWEEVLEDRLIPKRFGIVEPGKIYRSGQISCHLIEKVLKDNGIRVVVDLTELNPDSPHERAEIEAAKKLYQRGLNKLMGMLPEEWHQEGESV